MRSLNWFQIIVTAIVTGIVTIGTGTFLFYLQTKEPLLTYNTLETLPFSGQNKYVGIYQVSISNEGKKAVEEVICNIKIPEATIEQFRIFANPAMTYTNSQTNDILKISFPNINPLENVQLSVLATSNSKLPNRPEVSLRSKGTAGIEKSTKKENQSISYNYLLVLLASIMAAGATLTIFQRIIKHNPDEIILEERNFHKDDQRMILSYICMINGLTQEANYYIDKQTQVKYWAEADRLSFVAISSNDTEKMEKVKRTLENLLEYAKITDESKGIIFFNLARIEASQGNLEKMREFLDKAQEKAPKLVNLRIKMDPAFGSLEKISTQ